MKVMTMTWVLFPLSKSSTFYFNFCAFPTSSHRTASSSKYLSFYLNAYGIIHEQQRLHIHINNKFKLYMPSMYPRDQWMNATSVTTNNCFSYLPRHLPSYLPSLLTWIQPTTQLRAAEQQQRESIMSTYYLKVLTSTTSSSKREHQLFRYRHLPKKTPSTAQQQKAAA